MSCKHCLWGMRRKTIVVTIISMIIYASLTAIAAVQSRESAHDHENAMGNITKPPSSTVSPIDLYNAAVMTKLEYLFWSWTALTSAITFGFDVTALLLAGVFRSKFFSHVYYILMAIMTVLNLSPLIYVLDTGAMIPYYILTTLVFLHRIFNCVCVWFLLVEIGDFPEGTPPIPLTPVPSYKSTAVKPLGQSPKSSPTASSVQQAPTSVASGSVAASSPRLSHQRKSINV